MTISDRERKIVRQWAAEQSRPLTLELAITDHPRVEPLRAFCQMLVDQCKAVQVSEVNAAGEEMPALRLRQGALLYRTVPLGSELEPFLEALAGDGGKSGSGHGPLRTALLQIYVAAACPHCPAAVRAILPLVTPRGPLRLEVIDSEACSDLAEANRIQSVPTVILDRTFRWTGSIHPGDLEAMLATGDRVNMSAGVLGRLLEGGNAGSLTKMMVEAEEASPALCELLASEAMSVRLGAMMVMEELLELSPGLVELLIPDLQDNLAGAAEPAQGDILYILGEAGPKELAAEIEALVKTGLHPEVDEAAREALERLAERHQ